MKKIIIILSCLFLLISMVFASNINYDETIEVDSNMQGPLMEDGSFYSKIPKDKQIIKRFENGR